MNEFVDVALSYAAKGYLVFPCKPQSKKPATPNGFKDATTDPQTIRRWWSDNPDYNVAIRTGKESNLIVLDVDEGGEQTLKDNGWNATATVTIKTGKGFHHYYKHPGGTISTKVRLAEGIDVKADGGYVLAPPSVHPNGSAYEWIIGPQDAAIADAPEWLLQERPSKGLTTLVEATIPEGQRNDTLFSRARSLFAQGYDETEVFGALYAVNQNRCKPPLDDTEVLSIVESAAKYEHGTLYIANDDTEGFTANELMNMDISPMRWAIPDLLPEGVTVLGGKPKIGKSWLALGLCVATATGGVALGTKRVDQGDALYLALEDNKRRLQERLGKILTGEAPHNFQIYLEWPRLNEGGAEQLEQWLQTHPNARLVVIDTLEKIRRPAKGNGNVYREDYAALEALIPLAAKYGVAIVVVHHVRKMAADDPLDELNASTGLSGSVDSGWILKRGKGSADATLYVRGRDVEEQNLALRWDTQILGWRIVGEAAHFAMSDIRQQITRVIIEAGEPLGPKDVAERGNLDYEQVKKEMQRMADAEQLDKVGRGKYNVPSVPNVSVVPLVPSVPFDGEEVERDNEDNVVPFAVPVESA
jgi:hypothetical protein